MKPADLFSALAARPADAVALRQGTEEWTFGELLAAVEALLPRLAACRVLAVLADNSPAWAIADLAALGNGTVHLPLPTFFSPAQLHHALTETSTDVVLSDQPERISGLDLGFVAGGEWQGLTWLQRAVAPLSLPPRTAKISFTSGSSGTPKGVCLSAAGLLDTAGALHERLGDLPISRHLGVLPLALLLENSAGLYAPLLRGAEIVLPALASLGWRGMAGFDPSALQQVVISCRPQSLILVPELLKAWVMYLQATGLPAPDSLCYIAVGGARVAPELLLQARALGLPAYQGYGLTECGSVVSLNRPGDDGDDVGRPLPHVDVRIAKGEVHIASRAFLGYLGDPAAVAGARQTTEFATGDLGKLSGDGHLRLAGRSKNLLITSFGRNIAPEWVEAALLAQPAIAQAVVGGDFRPWLYALLVPAPGCGEPELAAAVERANLTLPDYARLGNWLNVPPFTPQNGQATGNGRPIRNAILEHHAAPIAALYENEETAHVFL
ncbi:AMP-binding protein [Dechloromonas sp. A34]|uniref:AMP-binding protein n=1 Tax=Dechloromonas sp. A34 TaxID=447588 RepID=UPI00224950CB|nr:AMP-binding protein [Dechloromonas sp. A34]